MIALVYVPFGRPWTVAIGGIMLSLAPFAIAVQTLWRTKSEWPAATHPVRAVVAGVSLAASWASFATIGPWLLFHLHDMAKPAGVPPSVIAGFMFALVGIALGVRPPAELTDAEKRRIALAAGGRNYDETPTAGAEKTKPHID